MTTSNPTTSFYWLKFSEQRLQKMSTNCCHTGTKLVSQWMMLIRLSSRSTWLNLTKNKPWSMWLTRSVTIRTTQLWTRMWLHSGHYNSNPSKGINNRDPIIEAINPRGNSTTKALSRTTSWQLNTKAPTTPETVNSVSTAKL